MVTFKLVLISLLQRQKIELLLEKKDKILWLNSALRKSLQDALAPENAYSKFFISWIPDRIWI